MTGQNLLDRMELVNQELQLQAGEADVVRGLVALNVAQDYLESLLASRGKSFIGTTPGNVVTAANTETTAFPAGVLRIDRMQVLDATTSRPKRELVHLHRTGGHAVSSFWPLNVVLPTASGEPYGYWTEGTLIYWNPLPAAVYTIRIYGLKAAADITAAGSIVYPDMVGMPLASFATRLMKLGVDDSATDVAVLAAETFGKVLDTMSLANRDGAVGFEYTSVHNS